MSKPTPHLLRASAALALLLALNAPVPAPAQSAVPPVQPPHEAPQTESPQTESPRAESSPTEAPPVAPGTGALMTGPQVIQVLDQTIDWYRTLGIQQQASTEPSDLLILYDNRLTANKVIGLAFEIARSNAEILAKQPNPKDASASASSQTLSQLKNKFAAQGAKVQAELDSDQDQFAAARPEQKVELQAKIAELQGGLDLINARKSLLATMSSFANQSDTSGVSSGALKAQIDAMAVTVPSASTGSASSNPVPPNAAAAGSASSTTPASSVPTAALTGPSGIAAARFGIWDLAANVVRLSEKAATIDAIDQRTTALETTFARFRAPLIEQLKKLSARGDGLATQAGTADSARPNRVHDQPDAFPGQFKEASSLLIPLSKVGVLL